jgi:undecaprenyl-diphosphatase
MSLAHAIALGILQGLGEFLPISSSGHLILFPWFMGWPDQTLAFDVALHLGTLVAVLVAFAGDWQRLLTSGVRGALKGHPFAEPDARLLWQIALASVPGGVAGLLLDEWAETTLRAPLLVAISLTVMGAGLFAADLLARHVREVPEMTWWHALAIGCAQAVAVIPGVSRSGATITMALLLGYRRTDSARFSFLLATPIILGAALYKLPHLFGSGHVTATLLGMAAAAVVGLASIRFLLRYVSTRDYRPFVYYRVALAVVTLVVLLARSS